MTLGVNKFDKVKMKSNDQKSHSKPERGWKETVSVSALKTGI